MDLWATVCVLARRWYAVLPVLVLVGIGVVLVPTVVPASHQATASVLFVPPATPESATTRGVNPYAAFDASLMVTAGAVAANVTDPSAAQDLLEAGATAAYTVVPQTGRSPVIDIISTDRDAAAAQSTADVLVQQVQTSLRNLQTEAGAPLPLFIRAVVVSRTATPAVEGSSRKRAAAGLLVVGLVLALAAGFGAESVLGRRTGGGSPRPRGPSLPAARRVPAQPVGGSSAPRSAGAREQAQPAASGW